MSEIKDKKSSALDAQRSTQEALQPSAFSSQSSENWAQRVLRRCGFRAPDDVAGALLRHKLFAQRKPPQKSNLLPFVPALACLLFLSVISVSSVVSAADPLRCYPVQVLSVHDGDTLTVSIDLGLDISKKEIIRLDGIDAPELNSPEGKAAKKFLIDRLIPPSGNGPVLIETTGKHEKFGRLLATLWAGDPPRISVNAQMIRQGLAREYHGEKRTPFASDKNQTEK